MIGRGRGIAIAALTVPVLAGIGYLTASAAPVSYVAVNAGAWLAACAWIACAPASSTVIVRRIMIAAALVLLFTPLITGPAVGHVARWLPLGPVALHAGMLAVPLLCVLVGEEQDYAPAILSAALLAALTQPDMAIAAALTLAAFGLADATRDWRYVAFAVAGFVVALVAAMHGELPAQPFVERVIFILARSQPLAALGLLASVVVAFYLIILVPAGNTPSRKALAGSLLGFSFAGLVSNYPSPLIGYGAAPVLGYGLALGLLGKGRADAEPSAA